MELDSDKVLPSPFICFKILNRTSTWCIGRSRRAIVAVFWGHLRALLHPGSAVDPTFLSFSLCFFLTFFSLFLLVRLSLSSASFSTWRSLAATSFSLVAATSFRNLIRLFLPLLFLLWLSASNPPRETEAISPLAALIVVTRHGNSHPG